MRETLSSAKAIPYVTFQWFRLRKTHVRKRLFCEDFCEATTRHKITSRPYRGEFYCPLRRSLSSNPPNATLLFPSAAQAVYEEARQRNPQRWSGPTRNWTPVGVITLNPERDTVVRAATLQIPLSGSIDEPAFPSRPGSAQATERNEGDGRSRATRSHAQRAVSREHGEAGEHRTFSAVSTVAHSSPAGG